MGSLYPRVLAFFLSIFLLPATAQTLNPVQAPPPLGVLVDVGGYRVHLYCTGTGSPTVVIVGAGPSFSWGLVQPEVAQTTRVCSYDHSGTTWSDDGPPDSCSLRVQELHTALRMSGITGPLVLVGHSVGAFVARLYFERYPADTVGIVLVDHAFSITHQTLAGSPLKPPAASQPTVPVPTPRGIESDPNFNRLSAHDQELQLWAMAQPRYPRALQTSAALTPGCNADLQKLEKGREYPLGDKPLVDVDRSMGAIADYRVLQSQLLSLSRNSREVIADDSGHFVMLDRPDLVIQAILQVSQSARTGQRLGHGVQ